jgi:molecular chaperone DnaK (HSP70)
VNVCEALVGILEFLSISEKALRDAKMDKRSINEVVLVGGSTRIPKIQKMLTDLIARLFFEMSFPCFLLNSLMK